MVQSKSYMVLPYLDMVGIVLNSLCEWEKEPLEKKHDTISKYKISIQTFYGFKRQMYICMTVRMLFWGTI